MARYAMLKRKKVIDIVDAEVVPDWPDTSTGIPIIAIECDETVERGMIYNRNDGTFAFPAPVEPEAAEPSQLDRIEAKIQVNEDLQAFYDEVMQEVGL